MSALMEAQLGRLGARWSLTFRPREQAVLASPLGRFYDHPFRLRVALVERAADGHTGELPFAPEEIRGGGPVLHAVGLPFDPTVTAAAHVQQTLRPASVRFDASRVLDAFDLHVEMLAPCIPGDVRASSVPAFLLTVRAVRHGAAPAGRRLALEIGFLPEFGAALALDDASVSCTTYFGPASDHPDPAGVGVGTSVEGTVGLWALRGERPGPDGIFRIPVPDDASEVSGAFAVIGHTASPVKTVDGVAHCFAYVHEFPTAQRVAEYVKRDEVSLRAATGLFEQSVLESSLDPAAQGLIAQGWQGYLTNTWRTAPQQAGTAADAFAVWDGLRADADPVGLLYDTGVALLLFWPALLKRQLVERSQLVVSLSPNAMQRFVLMLFGYWQWTDDWDTVEQVLDVVGRVVKDLEGETRVSPTAFAALDAASRIVEEAADEELITVCAETLESLEDGEPGYAWAAGDLLYHVLVDETPDADSAYDPGSETSERAPGSGVIARLLSAIVAAYAGRDMLGDVSHVWFDHVARNTTGSGGAWVEADEGERTGTRYGARGALAVGLLAAFGGFSLSRAAERVSLTPPRIPGHIPLTPLADWATLRLPWASLHFDKGSLVAEFTHEDLVNAVGDVNATLPSRAAREHMEGA